MSMSNSSGNTSVTGNVTTTIGAIGILTPSATQTIINARSNTNGNADLYTVTTGKTFYLMGVWSQNSGVYSTKIFKNDGTTVVAWMQTTATNTTSTSITAGGCPIWAYTSGQVVKGNGGGQDYGVWGVEQ